MDIDYVDLALRKADSYGTAKFTVDKTAPTDLKLVYAPHITERLHSDIMYRYYNEKVKVTVSGKDEIAGIDHIVYNCDTEQGVSKVNAKIVEEEIKNAKISKKGETFSATFTIPKDALGNTTQFNGNVDFDAVDRSGNTKTKKTGNRVVVDNIAPTMDVEFNQPVSTTNNVRYYDKNIEGTIRINEANFYVEDVTVTIEKDGRGINPNVSWSDESVDSHTGRFTLSEDGDYVVRVSYKDESGNSASEYVSEKLVKDTKTPTMEVSNIVPNTANKDEVYGFTITASDDNFDVSAFKPDLTYIAYDNGTFAEKRVDTTKAVAVKADNVYKVDIRNLEEDGIYTLRCKMTDKSGNSYSKFKLKDGKEYEEVQFSINRNGSTFYIDNNTTKLVDTYYVHDVEEAVVINEINADPIETYTVKVNGEEITPDRDYATSQTSKAGEWSKRTYKIGTDVFDKEAIYSVVVESTDKTGTDAYSDVKNMEVTFDVDRTAPVLTFRGVKQRGRYRTDEQTVVVNVTDDGGKVHDFKAEVLDKKGNPVKTDSGENQSLRFEMEGEELEKYLAENNNMVTFTIPRVLTPLSFAILRAASVSAVSPDWEITITRLSACVGLGR